MTFAWDWNARITLFMAVALAAALALPVLSPSHSALRDPLLGGAVAVSAAPLLLRIVRKFRQGQFGADALAVVSVITAFALHQFVPAAIIVVMLSGGAVLETWAVRNASSVLDALLRRMPKMAHRKVGDAIHDVAVESIGIGDRIVIYPHEIVPVDGVVREGQSVMDESFLTGEPFRIPKTTGSEVISGAINGGGGLVIDATRAVGDSRYAQITRVMRAAEEKRPQMRRLADRLSAVYTPLVLIIAGLSWVVTHDSERFLAVVIAATPCPLIIAVPIAIIGGISLSARRGIIVRDPVAMEQIGDCRTAIYDKTGTLTYGVPVLVEQTPKGRFALSDVLSWAASLERYSRHPLAGAVRDAASQAGLTLRDATEVRETAGHGLEGGVEGRRIRIVGRKQVATLLPNEADRSDSGLECFVLVDEQLAARYRFRDAPRSETRAFIHHLSPKHAFNRQVIISGDRESEVRYLANAVGISSVFAGKSPEEKLTLVREETARAKTLYIGDGINDAPALLAATVGIAIGPRSDVTSEAAGIVVMEGALRRVDEFVHISDRVRRIAFQCAVGGMTLSSMAMAMAALGHLPPVAGAIIQEIIDLFAIGNALRAARTPRTLADF